MMLRVAVLLALFAPLSCSSKPAPSPWPPAKPLAAPQAQSGELPPSLRAEPAGEGIWRVTFTYAPGHDVKSVHLAGSFNGWNNTAKPMAGPDDKGRYSARVTLGAGDYAYKFVENGDQWLRDPLNPDGVDDNHGGKNSVFYLGELALMKESPGDLGDGKIGAAGLVHRPDTPRYFQRVDADRALLRYAAYSHDVEHVSITIRNGRELPMHTELAGPVLTYWEATVDIPPDAKQLEYTFVLEDGETRVCDPSVYLIEPAKVELFETPHWARDAIWYQIMLDRFRNGDASNDPDPVRPWTSEWFTPSPWETRDGQTFYKYFVFSRLYGGDLAGLEEKLDYLKQLGVNALYLNPVFESPSHHKYNAATYMHVDDNFGTKGDYAKVVASEDLLDPSTWQWTESDKLFLRVLKRAKSLGFHVILDGVFNHVGSEHPAFQDVVKNGKDSRFADWFDVTSWEPFTYRGWAGVDTLPVFRKSATGIASESAKKHIFDITRRWMDPDGDGDPSDGIDGWRLDVPNEIPAPFWVEWRSVVKSVNPDAFITGEIWDRAEQWLDGKHFDAVMNYQFAKAAVAWVFNKKKKISASEIDRKLAELRLAYPAAATYVMQNLMDSHDTDRLASMALNPDRDYDAHNRVQDNGPNYNNARPGPAEYARARLVVLLQMTYVGAPMIYYGDEAGMWGADDPTCRKPMLWQDLEPYEKPERNFVSTEQLDFYRRAIALRNEHAVLRTGSFQTLLTDDDADVWAFERFDRDAHAIVVLNASDEPRDVSIALPEDAAKTWNVVFGGSGQVGTAQGSISLRVAPVSGTMLIATP